MKTTVRKWGNSMALRIPKAILDENNMHEGCLLEIVSKDGKIILEPQQHKVREGWAEAALEAHQNEDDQVTMDFPNEFDQEEWTW